MTPSSEIEEIPSLLRRVSRSFYLSLRLLPQSVRPTLSLAYLLARASDSIADAGSASVEFRRQLLSQLPGSLPQSLEAPGLNALPAGAGDEDRGPGRSGGVRETAHGQDAHATETGSIGRDDCSPWAQQVELLGALPDGETELLESLPLLLQRLDSSPDKEEILSVWRTILSGQIFDLQRFSPGALPLTLAEAVRYTGLVAGCVGRFWTEICFKHVAGYSKAPRETMCGLGFDFGCGLQWVNILRDRHGDAAVGRVYVTEADFSAAMATALANLDAGAHYASLVRPRRLRAACRLPLEIGIRTLDLVKASPQSSRVKVSRSFVWLSLARALWH